jgi:hypothetical protein
MSAIDAPSRASNRAPRSNHFARTSTWTYFGSIVRDPRRTWACLLADPARLRHGFLAVLSVGLCYALTVGGIAASNGTPSVPWLAIRLFQVRDPVHCSSQALLCWVLAGGVMHLLSKLFHGSGTFEDTLALLGFAVAIPTLISLIPDAVRAGLTTVGLLSRTAWEQAISRPGTPTSCFCGAT